MVEMLMPQRVEEDFEYKETYMAGATKDIPLSYQIDIFKHKTDVGVYCATEIKTHMVEHEKGLDTEDKFRNWARWYHLIFSEMPSEVERRMKRNGLDMCGNSI